MELGQEIKRIRKEKGYTLKRLSELTGITVSALSQIERGKNSPSMSNLAKITEALGVPIRSVFTSDKEKKKNVREVLIKKETRSRITLPNSELAFELLAPVRNSNIEFLFFEINEGITENPQFTTHKGEECVYVMEGRLKVRIDDREYIVERGNSFYFDSSGPHYFLNIGEGKVAGYIVVTPPAIITAVLCANEDIEKEK